MNQKCSYFAEKNMSHFSLCVQFLLNQQFFLQSQSEDYVCKIKCLCYNFLQLTPNTLAQETIERMPEIFSSEAPTLMPFLTLSSTSNTETMGKVEEMLKVIFRFDFFYDIHSQQGLSLSIKSFCAIIAHDLRICPGNFQQFSASHS